jgi:putative transposase
MRTAYRCRAYPDAEQQVLLNRTFGCVRVVWNRTLAARRARYATERASTSYAETDRALTAMKRDPELAFLGEVSCVPLQQALRHQHAAFGRSSRAVPDTRGLSPAAAASPPPGPGRRSG